MVNFCNSIATSGGSMLVCRPKLLVIFMPSGSDCDQAQITLDRFCVTRECLSGSPRSARTSRKDEGGPLIFSVRTKS
jgi:hypothetical protein